MKKPIIFSTLAAIGTVSGALAAVWVTPKAVQILEEKEGASAKEKILAVAPYYIPAAMIEAGTVACIFLANGISQKQIAALSAAYGSLWNFHEQYKKEVEKIAGGEISEKVWQAILSDESKFMVAHPSDEEELFYLEFYGDFFYRTREDVLYAEYELNRLFAIRGYATCNDFLRFLGLDTKDDLENIGWGQYTGEIEWGYYWIDFVHHRYEIEGGMEAYDIQTPYPPTYDYMDY